MRIIGGEERDALAVDGSKPRGRIGDLLAHDRRDDPREDADAEPPEERRAVHAGAGEPRADAEVGRPGKDRGQDCRELARIVLAVAVDLHRNVVAALEGEPVAGLDGAADPEVEREPEDVGAAVGRHSRGTVGRAVVDHHDVEARIEVSDLADHAADRLLLVQRGNDRDALELGELREHGVARRRGDGCQLSHAPQPGS